MAVSCSSGEIVLMSWIAVCTRQIHGRAQLVGILVMYVPWRPLESNSTTSASNWHSGIQVGQCSGKWRKSTSTSSEVRVVRVHLIRLDLNDLGKPERDNKQQP